MIPDWLRNPDDDDPGDGWFRLTYGEYSGWWIDLDAGKAVVGSTGECVLDSDLESFRVNEPENYKTLGLDEE